MLSLTWKNKILKYLIFVLLPLILGIIIYLLFRPLTLNIFSIIKLNNVKNELLNIRQSLNIKLPKIIVYSIPHGLWSYSFLCASYFIWNNRKSANSIFWLVLSILICLFSEVGQLFHFISGVFDINDLIIVIISIVLFFITIKYEKKIKF